MIRKCKGCYKRFAKLGKRIYCSRKCGDKYYHFKHRDKYITIVKNPEIKKHNCDVCVNKIATAMKNTRYLCNDCYKNTKYNENRVRGFY